jgi:hypothetical protein
MKTLFTLLLLASAGVAQKPDQPEDMRVFKLDVVVREVEAGKVVSSRNYSVSLAQSSQTDASLRTGDRVPIPGSKEGQFSFLEAGTSIDFHYMQIRGNDLIIRVTADISSIVPSPNPSMPVVNTTRWNAPVIVPLRKPTIVFSSDSASTKRQMQLEITATPLQ